MSKKAGTLVKPSGMQRTTNNNNVLALLGMTIAVSGVVLASSGASSGESPVSLAGMSLLPLVGLVLVPGNTAVEVLEGVGVLSTPTDVAVLVATAVPPTEIVLELTEIASL